MYLLCDNNPSYLPCDLGFGSRVIAWSHAKTIADLLGEHVTVVVPKDEWVEHEFIHFPGTVAWSRDRINLSDWREVQACSEWETSEYWRINREAYDTVAIEYHSAGVKFYSKDPIFKLKFIHQELNEFFDGIDFDFALNIRRWAGIPILKKDVKNILESLPKRVRPAYIQAWKKMKLVYDKFEDVPDSGYIRDTVPPPFIFDEQYYEVIDKVRSKLPDSKWYLMSDLPKELYQYYLDKYPNMFSTKEDYLYEWMRLISKYYDITQESDMTNHFDYSHYSSKESIKYGHAAIDLLDWYMCAKSRGVLASYTTQFVQSANRVGCLLDTPVDLIMHEGTVYRIGMDKDDRLNKLLTKVMLIP